MRDTTPDALRQEMTRRLGVQVLLDTMVQGIRVEGDLATNDRLLLMTDALAHWFLVEAEMGRRPWAALARLTTPEQFAAFIDCLRAGGALRNDDVTLVNVEVAA